MSPLRVLSLGAGVQSSALALMLDRGALPAFARPDCAIFADTQREPRAVYEHLAWLETLLSYPVRRVTRGDLGTIEEVRRRTGEPYMNVPVPMFTVTADGRRGMLSRECSSEYKVKPIAAEIRRLRGDSRRKVVQYLGISMDESHRMRQSRVGYAENVYPLVEACVTRADCDEWFFRQTGRHAPRSACVFCPYHDDAEWQDLEPEDVTTAADYERRAQEACAGNERIEGTPYLHRHCVPIREVRLKPRRKAGREGNLFSPFNDEFGNECEGMCGV